MSYTDVEDQAESMTVGIPAGSPESLESYSERVSLLPPDVVFQTVTYKSTHIVTREDSSSQDEGILDERGTSKSAFTVISLLLVGNNVPSLLFT